MKKWIKGSLIFLGTVLAAGLLACGRTSELKNELKGNTEDGPVEIAIENVTLGAQYPDTGDVEARINEITVPAIGCRVKIVNCHISEHKNQLHLAASGTKKLDVINTGLTVSLPELVSEGAVLELNSLLEDYGKGILDKNGALLKATTIDGGIYAVFSNPYPGRASGIGYNESIARQFGIQVPEPLTLAALTQIGEQLKATDSGVYLTTQGDGALTAFDSFYDIEDFGGDFNYGVIFNPLESTEIVNVYTSEAYRDYCLTLKSWRDQGFMPQDSLISGQSTQEMFNNGETFFQWSSVSPQTYSLIEKKNLSFNEVLVAMTPNRISTANIQEFAWGISSSCEHPEKAMELMNLIYTNAEVANLLRNGREGIDYVKTGERTIAYADGINSENVGYGSYFSLYGDPDQIYAFGSDVSADAVKEFAAQSVPGKTLGYVFRTEHNSPEISAVLKVVREYRPVLENGMADDVDQTLEAFNKALVEAGIETIIAENRRQLNLWLEEQNSSMPES